MRCVNVKTDFLQCRFLDEADLVTRNVDFEGLWDESVHNDLCIFVFCTGEDNVEVRSSLFGFAGPILERCCGDED